MEIATNHHFDLFQRSLPTDATDLFTQPRNMELPTQETPIFTIRPYLPTDEVSSYSSLCYLGETCGMSRCYYFLIVLQKDVYAVCKTCNGYLCKETPANSQLVPDL